MLGIKVAVLYGFAAAVALRVEAGEELNPRSATFVASARPGLPRGLPYIPMYIFR